LAGMLAYRRAATLRAAALAAVVVAVACAPAYIALAPSAVKLAHRRAATLLALTLAAVVVADTCAIALFALSFVAIMGALALGGPRHVLFHFRRFSCHQRQIPPLLILLLSPAVTATNTLSQTYVI
jgi:hypothetical protein